MKYERDSTYLIHYGILGQKWGVRRFQNEDGTLTIAGKERYYTDTNKAINKKVIARSNDKSLIKYNSNSTIYNKEDPTFPIQNKNRVNTFLKVLGGIAVSAAVVYGVSKINKSIRQSKIESEMENSKPTITDEIINERYIIKNGGKIYDPQNPFKTIGKKDVADRISITTDLAHGKLSRGDLEKIIKDDRIHNSFWEYSEERFSKIKKPQNEWDESHASLLMAAAVAEFFDENYLWYLFDVGKYLRKKKA